MKKLIYTALFATSSLLSFAQGSAEFGFNAGFSSYLGDLVPQAYTFKDPGVAMGIQAKHNMTPHITMRAFMNVMRISGSDANSGNQTLINRNLSFRTNVLEYGGALEINVLPFDRFNPNRNKDKRHFSFTPYFYGGDPPAFQRAGAGRFGHRRRQETRPHWVPGHRVDGRP